MKRTSLLSCLFCSLALAQPMPKPMLGDQIDWSNPLSRGLVGCWLMNEGGGTTIRTLAGGVPPITIPSSVSWDIDQSGTGLLFSGSSGSALTPTLYSAIQSLNSCSLVAWVKFPGASPEFEGIIGSYHAFDLLLRDSGRLRYQHLDGTYTVDSSGFTFDQGKRYCIAFSWNGATCTLYADGKGIGSGAASGAFALTAEYSYIGAVSGPNYGNVSISGLFLYSRALSPSEVASLYRDPYQMFRRERPEMCVSAGGSPPTPNRVRVIVISGLPFWVILSMVGLLVYDKQERKRAA